MPVGEWHTRSFLIELKPRAEFASLFVDCPPINEENVQSDAFASGSSANDVQKTELVKVGEHALELKDIENGNVESNSVRSRFYARIADLCLHPNTVCALTWADHSRLFMCKVHAEADGLPLGKQA
ncbi:unnamed protein product [Toxocara canis]|uniref:ANAPC4_WD40 domain-containing protein n=1 Tax=Toxocara canis TaxID=6265 RepID=A0A183UTH2_TOXCA|nr:unnamed protein product [Toxocara canis]